MNARSPIRTSHGAALLAMIALAVAPSRRLAAQSLEGSKWRIEQEGMDSAIVWWLGSEGRVRTGDLGIILPAYKWRQAGDSVFVTIGDTVKYAAVLMSNRLVGGIRSGRNRPEGWWSGMRADAATAATPLASTPATQAPVTTPASTQQLSRPTDSTSTPPGTNPAPAAGQGERPLRSIRREGAATSTDAGAPAGGGRVIRRIERAEAIAAAAQAPATGAIDTAMVGGWVRADSVGMVDGFDLAADGKATVHLRNGGDREGTWASDAQSTHITLQGENGNEVRVVIWEGGPGLRGTILSAAGPRRTLAFRRAPAHLRQ